MASTTELILKFTGDKRQLAEVIAAVRGDLSRLSTGQVNAVRDASKQTVNETARAEQKRLADTIKSANQRLREEQRAAREVARIVTETARQAERQERLRERAAKQLADVQIREARRAALELERTLKQQRQAAGTGSAFLAGAVGGVTALVGLNVVNELRQAGRAWLDYSSKLETTRIAFTTMLGSAQAAEEHLKELQAFALKTPFQFIELIDASQRMQALGFNAKQVIPILTDVGNAVAGAGGGSERLDRVVLAISQIQSKGKVATQEMNQLAEAGIPAWKILEQQFGKSRAELVKMVEQGQISSKVFLEAFQKFSQVKFGGLMEQQSRTFSGAMSNITDTLLQASATAFEPFFKKISEITTRVAEELQKGQPTLETVTRSITSALVEIIATAGTQAATGFIESTVRKIGDPAAWKQLLANVSGVTLLKPFFTGLFSVDPEDLFGLGEVDIPTINLPDLKVPLQNLKEQQKEVSETTKKVTDLISNLSLKLAFYGQTTEKANVQQQLLKLGMEALTSAEGRRAIQLAELIDKQRISNELTQQQEKFAKDLAAITEGKYKAAFESLTRTIDDARISIVELSAAETGGLTPLQRFNLTLGAQVEGMLSVGQATAFTAEQIALLRTGVSEAQTALAKLTLAQLENKRAADIKAQAESVTQLLRRQADELHRLRFGAKTAIDEVNDFIKLMPAWAASIFASDIALLKLNARLIESAERVRRMIELMREMSNAVPQPGGRVPEGTPNVIVTPEQDAAIQIEVFGKIIDQISIWQEAMNALKRQMEDFSQFARTTFVESLFGIADALAQGVATWALYGGSFGKAMKQALAALGAKITAEAILMAAIHAAYAIGSLAFGNFGAAAQHALAAAKFAAIGGAAALATRALAGNDFKQNSGNAFQGTGGRGTAGTAASARPQPIDLDRTTRSTQNQQIVREVLEVRFTGKLGEVIETQWIDRYTGGGRLRNVVLNDRDV